MSAVARHEDLLPKAHALCQHPSLRSAVWKQVARLGRTIGGIDALSTRIHDSDQMLRHSLRHFGDANFAVSQYFAVALQQSRALHQILACVRASAGGRDVGVLDFACGFGRSLRFLTQFVPPHRVWAADIQRDAVDFVAHEFSVNGLYSTSDPQEFRPDERFDLIWAASLFSHLPERLFRGWLAQLSRLLAPAGVLCFSVRDEALLGVDVALPDSGIHFTSAREIEEFDGASYGTSYVSEAFVRSAIAACPDLSPAAQRLRRSLANEQDLYVVARGDAHRDVASAFRRGPWGWVDVCRVSSAGRLYITGWAASLDGVPIREVLIRFDDDTVAYPTRVHRGDVGTAMGNPRLDVFGWEIAASFPRASVFVQVCTRTDDDEALLYAGPVDLVTC